MLRKKKLLLTLLLGAFCVFTIGSVQNAAALTEKMTLDELSVQANQIVHGTVIKTECFQIEDGRIYTTATVAIGATLKGGDRGKTVSVTIPGGTVGELSMVMSEAPTFTEGEEVVLFLKDQDNRLAGWFQGKYVVIDGVAYPSAPNCAELILEGGLPVDELLSNVRQSLLEQAE